MLALVIAPLLAPEPKLAFVARIYYPPSDKRISRYQLYVSDLYGGHRRQLTYGKEQILTIRWIGRDALFWSDEDGRCFVSKLSPFKPRQVTISDNAEFEPLASRGDLVFHEGDSLYYRFTMRGVATMKRNEAWPLMLSYDDTSTTWKMPSGGELKVVDGESPWRIQFGGREYKLAADSIRFHPLTLRGNKLVFDLEDGAGAHGRDDTIYSLDLDSGRFTKLVDAIGFVDFSYDSPYYAGLSFGGRGTVPYGKTKQVWAAKLYAGNWRTGKRWLVLGGIVHVQHVAVQPE